MSESLSSVLSLDVAWAALISVASGLIHGYTGFGAAFLMVPLFAILFGPVESIAVVSIVVIVGTMQLYPSAARNTNWRELVPIWIAAVICAPLGVALLFNLDPEVIRRSMGAAVCLAALILMRGWVYKGPRGTAASAVAGGLAGGFSGAVGVGGPPLVLYFLSSPQSIEHQRANIIIAVAVVVSITFVFVMLAGGVGQDTLSRAAILTPAYVLGTWSGNRLFDIAPKYYFRRVAMWLLLATGIGVLLF